MTRIATPTPLRRNHLPPIAWRAIGRDAYSGENRCCARFLVHRFSDSTAAEKPIAK